jgi:hypothetical protein
MKNRTRFHHFAIMIALSCFCHSVNASPTDTRMLIKRIQEKLKASKSISYDIKYRSKCFDCEDTTLYDAHVDILRVPEDSLAGCYLVAKYKNGMTKLYDGENIYYITLKDTSIEVVDTKIYKWNPTRGNFADGVFSTSFLNPSKLDYYSDSTIEISFLHDSLVRDKELPLKIIMIKGKDNDGFMNYPSYRAIDPALNFGVYSRGVTKWESQDKYQYDEASFSNVEFDKVDSDYFKHYPMPKNYRIWNYTPKKPLKSKTACQ